VGKVLISWMAYENDFIKGKAAVNSDGPTVSVHNYFYNYDKHILLTTAKNTKDDTKYQYLVSHLRNTFPHTIEEVAMSIDDVISLEEISAKVNRLLLTQKNNDIDVFISPGTPTMQVAWYFAHQSLALRTSLFQLRKAQHSKQAKAEQVWVDLKKSVYASNIIVKEQLSVKPTGYKSKKIIGVLKDVYSKADKIIEADHVPILISGDTGTGKELLANYIHENSPRSKSKFVPVNCAAFGNELLESRLFGYVSGAFTGALKDTQGLFHEANGGTIFLDEIGDITPYMQQTLLRVLQEKQILRVGSRETEKVDVRVVAATNKDLYELSMENKFREDLYYRLAVTELRLPSLTQYKQAEKEEIFDYLWNKNKKEFKKKEPKLTTELKSKILEYPFPGNIREMENLIIGILAEADENVILTNIPNRVLKPQINKSLRLIDVENEHIRHVLLMTNNNKAKACKILGIARNTLESRISQYNLI
jgi:two-component system response regulator HydG